MSNIVYHYCNIEKFKNIIKTGKLRFSDIRQSNDDSEICLLYKKCSEFLSSNINCQLGNSMRFFSSQQMENTSYCGACFSFLKDDAYMWNNYGMDKGTTCGLSIGFDEDSLIEWSKHIGWFCDNLYYCSNQLDNPIAKCDKIKYYGIDELLKKVELYFKNVQYITDNFAQIFYDSCFCKSDQWSSEKEFRIILPLINSGQVGDVDKYNLIKIDCNFNCYKVKYYDIPLDKKIIKEVVLSPNFEKNNVYTKQKIQDLLISNNYVETILYESSNKD